MYFSEEHNKIDVKMDIIDLDTNLISNEEQRAMVKKESEKENCNIEFYNVSSPIAHNNLPEKQITTNNGVFCIEKLSETIEDCEADVAVEKHHGIFFQILKTVSNSILYQETGKVKNAQNLRYTYMY